ncbi:MAG: 3-hydroxyacyl-ACP dehydratase FabZ [Candidatus Helarchaeota archaeon]|nr:3-hydroxyacyl-ACP dehydratase FabZ [Candidatus Helarchaeota archaeon]
MEKIRRKNLIFDIEDIRRRLPHRFPFLMLDKIVEQKPGYCKGIKNITINEWQFMGHFPKQAIMPGMLIAEAIAQTGAFVGPPPEEISKEEKESLPKESFLISMDVKFLQPVTVGDQMAIEVKFIKKIGKMNMFYGEVKVENMLVTKAKFTTMDIE